MIGSENWVYKADQVAGNGGEWQEQTWCALNGLVSIRFKRAPASLLDDVTMPMLLAHSFCFDWTILAEGIMQLDPRH